MLTQVDGCLPTKGTGLEINKKQCYLWPYSCVLKTSIPASSHRAGELAGLAIRLTGMESVFCSLAGNTSGENQPLCRAKPSPRGKRKVAKRLKPGKQRTPCLNEKHSEYIQGCSKY